MLRLDYTDPNLPWRVSLPDEIEARVGSYHHAVLVEGAAGAFDAGYDAGLDAASVAPEGIQTGAGFACVSSFDCMAMSQLRDDAIEAMRCLEQRRYRDAYTILQNLTGIEDSDQSLGPPPQWGERVWNWVRGWTSRVPWRKIGIAFAYVTVGIIAGRLML